MDFVLGTKILEEVDSPINGRIRVVRSLAFGTYIQVDNLTQSGGVVEEIWRKTLKKIHNSKFIIHNSLILGLGGGTAAKIVRKLWPASRGEPDAKITGVEIDPIMIGLGKKYLGLGNIDVDIKIQDAYEFVTQVSNVKTQKYDLILMDLYVGYGVPEKFTTDFFLRFILKLLSGGGIAVFNRLYFDRKRVEAVKFGNKLKKVFGEVEIFYPEANVMFICKN